MALHLLVLMVTGLALAGCDSSTPDPGLEPRDQPPQERRIARVAVDRHGLISLNSRRVTLTELAQAFRELKKQGGVVWYYRENPSGDPPESAEAVIQAIIDARLPLSLSSRPDFSDVVRPRRP